MPSFALNSCANALVSIASWTGAREKELVVYHKGDIDRHERTCVIYKNIQLAFCLIDCFLCNLDSRKVCDVDANIMGRARGIPTTLHA